MILKTHFFHSPQLYHPWFASKWKNSIKWTFNWFSLPFTLIKSSSTIAIFLRSILQTDIFHLIIMFHNINIILKNKYNQKVNGESNSFSKGCFVSFSERLACSVGMRQSIPSDSSKIVIPHQPRCDRRYYTYIGIPQFLISIISYSSFSKRSAKFWRLAHLKPQQDNI